MNKLKTFKGACLVAVTSMLPLSQAAMSEVTISGWVSEGMTFYDDGDFSDAVQTTVGGNTLGSRIDFAGSSEVSTGITAGFQVTLEPRSGGLDWGTLGHEDENFGEAIGAVLYSNVHVGGAWGKVTVGLQSMPTDNIAVLEDPSLTLWSGISPIFRGTGVTIRDGAGGPTASVWGDFLNCMTAPGLRGIVGIGLDCNGVTRNGIRYDLPAFGPVSIAIGYANDDIYDIMGKWKGDLGRMKASIALGYAINQGPFSETGAGDLNANPTGARLFSEAENFQMQAGLMDPTTGLFGSIAYQHEESDMTAAAKALGAGGVQDETDAWWLKVGIKKQWFSLGNTSISFDYGQYDDQYGAAEAAAGVTGSEVQRIGVAVDQYFGSSLIIFGKWENLDLSVDGAAATAQAAYGGADDLDTFSLGAVYFF